MNTEELNPSRRTYVLVGASSLLCALALVLVSSKLAVTNGTNYPVGTKTLVFSLLVATFAFVSLPAFIPKYFYPLLITAAVLGCGPTLYGYGFVDEYLTVCLTVGAGIFFLNGGIPWAKQTQSGVFFLSFTLFCLYMMAQSIRGIGYLEDWRLLRYFFYFGLLAAVTFWVASPSFRWPSSTLLSRVVLWATSFHLALYLVQGIYFEKTLGRWGRFLTQGHLWEGSAYAVFPLVIATPVALLSLRRTPFSALVYLFFAVLTAAYFNSRAAVLCLIGFALVSLSLKTLKAFLPSVLLAGGLAWIYANETIERIAVSFEPYLAGVLKAVGFLFIGTGGSSGYADFDRQSMFYAGVHTWLNDWITFIFGRGYYSHRVAVIPAMRAMGAPLANNGIIRPTGIAALLVDTGLIGVVLFTLVFVFAVRASFRSVEFFSREGRILSAFWLFFLMWFFICNLQDSLLFFLMLLPGGVMTHFWLLTTKNERFA